MANLDLLVLINGTKAVLRAAGTARIGWEGCKQQFGTAEGAPGSEEGAERAGSCLALCVQGGGRKGEGREGRVLAQVSMVYSYTRHFC